MTIYKVYVITEGIDGVDENEVFYAKKEDAEKYLNERADYYGIKVVDNEFCKYNVDAEIDFAQGIIKEIEVL